MLSVCFSPDGKYLASGSGDNTICLIHILSLLVTHQFKNLHTSNTKLIVLNYLFIKTQLRV